MAEISSYFTNKKIFLHRTMITLFSESRSFFKKKSEGEGMTRFNAYD
jgi:hypothetical protein